MTGSRIIVGVDDSAGARSALSWAAAECGLRDSTLLLLHVPVHGAESWLGGWGSWGGGVRAADALGSMLLDELAFGTRLRFPQVPIDLLLGHGDPAGTLIDLSAVADLVVLGTTGPGGNLLSLIGSVSARVAAQARCPVAVVPQELQLPGPAGPAPTVVVGVSATAAGTAALRFAFDEAHRRGCGVTAVRAEPAPEPGTAPGPAAGSAVGPAAGPGLAEARLRAELAEFTERFPDVPVTPLVARTHPAEAVLQAARTAALVVVGAHHSDEPWSSRLGPVPQTVLHHTRCPVVVIGTPHAHYPEHPAAVPAEA
ncbi:MAG TPA: universal stress protein [Jatrophihabitans sp.]|nr:universal stress protein [Jatrophihabitans sp.]